MKNFQKRIFIIIIIITLFCFPFLQSCEKDFSENQNTLVIQKVSDIKFSEDVLVINSKESLQNIINDFKANEINQEFFYKTIKSYQDKGFKPLTPIFEDNDSSQVEDFINRKIERLNKRNVDYGLLSRLTQGEDEIDLDDELIFDPAFSSLLNENREIIVGEKFYKYTEMGLFFCDIEDVVILDNYLNNMTVAERIQVINDGISSYNPCDNNIVTSINENINLFQEFIQFEDCGGGIGSSGSSGSSGSTNNPPSTNGPYSPSSDLVKQNLPICNVTSNSLWEMIFGPTEGCRIEMVGDKRVKTKFWNQNYFMFSSIGCKVKFQKHVTKWYASWWEKSYADKLELGVNFLTYEYNFNVPAFNQAQYNYETTFFEYNGTKYNSNGQVINTIPTSSGSFVFDTQSNQSIMNITIMGYHVTNSNLNQVIDTAVSQMVNGIQNTFVKYGLINKLNEGVVKFNVVNAVPFSNKVKFITSDVKWTSNNSHKIEKYFDMNFLFTWKNDYSGIFDYLQGLTGSTDYTNVSADIYGAAKSSNQWSGYRMKYNFN